MYQKGTDNRERYVVPETDGAKRRRRIYSYLMNCAAPFLTVIFLAGSVCWAAELQYDNAAEFDSNPEAAAVLAPGGVLAESGNYIETKLPKNGAVSSITENTGAELVEAYGVYIDNEFIGAVVSGEHIEEELESTLEKYTEDESVIEAGYAVETDLKQGIYRSAALVSAEEMTEYLAGQREVVTEYTADDGDTPEKLAEDFGTTVEDIKELNPDIENIEAGSEIKIKETVPVLPVKYTCEVKEEEELEYKVIAGSDGSCYSGGEAVAETGEMGKRVSLYEVTYIDGEEVARVLKDSETVLEPVDGTELFSESIPVTESDATFSGVSFIWPVDGGTVSDPFMSDRNHKGMDIAADSGTDIYAAAGGVVTDAGWNDGGYGNYVMIDHGNGYVTLYGHASEVYVSAGDKVSEGDVIAAVGTTGDSTGNHCHFEIRFMGDFLDPDLFLNN